VDEEAHHEVEEYEEVQAVEIESKIDLKLVIYESHDE
jgi:hypothetical protein